MKKLLTLVLVFSLTGCFLKSRPSQDLTVTYDESAPAEWKLGWQHGCESGFSAYGNDYYKSLYKFKQDVTLVSNEYYFKAWNDAFNFCRSYINRILAGDYKGAEDVPSLFSTNSLNITQNRRRDDAPMVGQSVFGAGGKAERGLMADQFDVKVPGTGSTAWGASASKCDWLNRCGADKPKDPFDAWTGGSSDPVGSWWGDW